MNWPHCDGLNWPRFVRSSADDLALIERGSEAGREWNPEWHRNLREPSSGLEPENPSLPLRRTVEALEVLAAQRGTDVDTVGRLIGAAKHTPQPANHHVWAALHSSRTGRAVGLRGSPGRYARCAVALAAASTIRHGFSSGPSRANVQRSEKRVGVDGLPETTTVVSRSST